LQGGSNCSILCKTTVGEKQMKVTGKSLLALGLTLGASVGVGVMAEGHTNEVAEGKIITVDTCLKIAPHETKISKELRDCMDHGVPGGKSIDSDHFRVGDPIEFVESYRAAQVKEAASIEVGRLAIWSVVPIIVGGGLVYFDI
jgi:hypothetical protein